MGPSRKRSRPNPPIVEDDPKANPLKETVEDTTSITSKPPSLLPVISSRSNQEVLKEDPATALTAIKNADARETQQLKGKGSWYGTWPRKSKAASTQVVRETIIANKSTNVSSNTDMPRAETTRKSSLTTSARPPSMCLGKSKETLDITRGGMEGQSVGGKEAKLDKAVEDGNDSAKDSAKPLTGIPADVRDRNSSELRTTQRPVTSSSWLGGWLGKPTVQPAVPEDHQGITKDSEQPPVKEPHSSNISQPDLQMSTAPLEDEPKQIDAPFASSSWFGLWSTAAPSTAGEAPKGQVPVKLSGTDEDAAVEGAPSAALSIAEPAAGSTWAFWSNDSSKKAGNVAEKSSNVGELAVSGEPSQDHPEPAKTATVKLDKKNKSIKRGRPQSLELDETSTKSTQLDPKSAKVTPSQSPAPAKASPPNLLLPSVKSTYRLVENPSILQQIARLLLHGQQRPARHVSLVKEPPKIRNALAIGIHGLFPAPLLRTVIGQPTGTSIRFANHAATAIRRWTDSHGSLDCEIEKVALEGEGKIGERVDNLWKLLLNWIDHVRKADFIMIACHSQGVPVALMLIAKLIEFSVVSTGKIGVCAMAGVSLGPFADYKSRLFSGSAGELFEFANPESAVSKRYEESLRVAVKYGVKITYCGSIDDQLVSMESSIFSAASHPYIYRAVFVDGRIHAPDFLSHLVGFALKLRNLGVSDHGLIRELSAPLAGSLYTGEGHSRLYDDAKVYDLAIEYALETTSIGDVPLEVKKYEIPTNANPYHLPWIMRGMLEEDFVKTELDAETGELLKQFDDWKPATKVLKDVKYRLEAVRSKL